MPVGLEVIFKRMHVHLEDGIKFECLFFFSNKKVQFAYAYTSLHPNSVKKRTNTRFSRNKYIFQICQHRFHSCMLLYVLFFCGEKLQNKVKELEELEGQIEIGEEVKNAAEGGERNR